MAKAQTETITVDGREVAISNPEKVLFPDAGYTKLDVVRYFLDVADGAGKVTNWAIEASTPNQLYRAGWRKDDVKIGDTVTLTDTSPARNGSPKASGGTLTLASGRKVFSGSPEQ